MARFYLINSVQVGIAFHGAGQLIDDRYEDVAGILSVGGILVTEDDPIVAEAGQRAAVLKQKAQTGANVLDTLMLAAYADSAAKRSLLGKTVRNHFGDVLEQSPEEQEIGGLVRFNSTTVRIEHVATHVDARAWIAKYGGNDVGTLDCSTALNTALAAGSHVHLAPGPTGGTLYLCKGLTVPDGVEFTGRGGATLLRNIATVDGTAIISRVGRKCAIRNLEFDGQRTPGDLTGIALSYSGLSYRAAIVADGSIANCDGLIVEDCSFNRIHGGGVMARDVNNLTMRRCASDGSAFEILFATASTGNRLRGCKLIDVAVTNLHAYAADPSVIHGDFALIDSYDQVEILNTRGYDLDAGIKLQNVDGFIWDGFDYRHYTFKNFGPVHVQNNSRNGTVCNGKIEDAGLGITVGAGGAAQWVTGTPYVIGAIVYSNGNLYTATTSATSGAAAPTHTNGVASDGGVIWQWTSQSCTNVTVDNVKIRRIGVPQWLTATQYAIGDRAFNGANTYVAASAGVSGASAPTHTVGTESDGAVDWTWVSAAYLLADGIQMVSANGHFAIRNVTIESCLRYGILGDKGNGPGTVRIDISGVRIVAGTGVGVDPGLTASTSRGVKFGADAGDVWDISLDDVTVEGYGADSTAGLRFRGNVAATSGWFRTLNLRNVKVLAGASAPLTTSPIFKGVAGQPDVTVSGTPVSKTLDMRVVIDSTAVGTDVEQATFRWSSDGGHTWTRGVLASATPAVLGTTGYAVAFTSGTYATTHSWSWQAWVNVVALQLDGFANAVQTGDIRDCRFEGSTTGNQAATDLSVGPNVHRGARALIAGRQRPNTAAGVTDTRPVVHYQGDAFYDAALSPPIEVKSDGAKWRDAAGVVSAPGTNLFANPSAFDTSSWSRQFLTATPNADSDPSGGSEADLLLESTAGTQTHQFTQNPARAATQSTFRIRVRGYGSDLTSATGRTKFEFVANNLAIKVDFDVVAVTTTTVAGAGLVVSKSLVALGDDWFQFECVFADDGTSTIQVRLRDASGATNYVTDTTKGAEFWLAELYQ